MASSSGVTVARALAGRPRVVWADEPTGALDSETAGRVMELLCELNADGLTLIVVTHDEGVGHDRGPARAHARRADRERRAHGHRVASQRWVEMLIVAILSLPFLYVLIRHPVLRRLALRNVARRPRETMLVILGSLLGTAIMTGSFVVGDTFTSSIRRGAYEQLGPIDEVVSVDGIAAGAALRARSTASGVPTSTGSCRSRRERVGGDGHHPRRAAPTSQLLETDFAAARPVRR